MSSYMFCIFASRYNTYSSPLLKYVNSYLILIITAEKDKL